MTDNQIESSEMLLTKKRDILAEILRITKVTNVTVDETLDPQSVIKETDKACEEYISLYEKRTILFSKIADIDAKTNKITCASDCAGDINKQIQTIAAELIALDKKNSVISEKLSTHIKKSIKDMNVAKLARNKYNNESHDTGASYFDKKQ